MQPATIRPSLSEPKRKAIIAAAREAFLRDGYGVSMDAVATAASVSKQTIYNHFGSKEELFKAVVDEVAAQLLAPLADPQTTSAAPRDALTDFGLTYLRLLLAPSSLALHRIIIAEAPRFPNLTRAIFSSGPDRAITSLAAHLAEADRRGLLRVPDPERSAEQFFGMVNGFSQLRALMLVRSDVDEGCLRQTVDYAVATFIRAHRPDV
jgi:TetR/AcrR family transcriptional repressor of mexJK operon